MKNEEYPRLELGANKEAFRLTKKQLITANDLCGVRDDDGTLCLIAYVKGGEDK